MKIMSPGKQLQEQAPKVERGILRLSSGPEPLLSPPGHDEDDDLDNVLVDNDDDDDDGDDGDEGDEDEDDHTIVKSGRKAV